MTIDEYYKYKNIMLSDKDWGHQIEWAENVSMPDSADNMAMELIFVICNSGMHHKAARSMYEKIKKQIEINRPPSTGTNHQGKGGGMDHIWNNRFILYGEAVWLGGTDLVEWCGNLPWIGKITKYHAAKNLGADVVKPDRWLERIAEKYNTTPYKLCKKISDKSGDRIGTVDLVLWWAAANGYILNVKTSDN